MKDIFSVAHIESTDICNLRCYSCRRPRTGHTIMKPDTFKKILYKLRNENVQRVFLHWRGEPCLSPYLPELAKITKDFNPNIFTYVSTNTAVPNLHNTTYLTKLLNHLNKIEVCVDGYNQESLSKYRVGAKWNMLIKNLEAIGKVKTGCIKEMRVLMFSWNEGKEGFFRELARKYKMNFISFAQPIINDKTVISLEEKDYWLTKDPKYWRYYHRRKGATFVLVHLSREYCALHCIITASGEVAYCGVDMPMKYGSAGNILREPLEVIKARYWQFAPKMCYRQLEICQKHYCCMPRKKIDFREPVKE